MSEHPDLLVRVRAALSSVADLLAVLENSAVDVVGDIRKGFAASSQNHAYGVALSRLTPRVVFRVPEDVGPELLLLRENEGGFQLELLDEVDWLALHVKLDPPASVSRVFCELGLEFEGAAPDRLERSNVNCYVRSYLDKGGFRDDDEAGFAASSIPTGPLTLRLPSREGVDQVQFLMLITAPPRITNFNKMRILQV